MLVGRVRPIGYLFDFKTLVKLYNLSNLWALVPSRNNAIEFTGKSYRYVIVVITDSYQFFFNTRFISLIFPVNVCIFFFLLLSHNYLKSLGQKV